MFFSYATLNLKGFAIFCYFIFRASPFNPRRVGIPVAGRGWCHGAVGLSAGRRVAPSANGCAKDFLTLLGRQNSNFFFSKFRSITGCFNVELGRSPCF